MEELRRKQGEDGVREVEMNFKKRKKKKRILRREWHEGWTQRGGHWDWELCFLSFLLAFVACGILRPQPGIEPGCPTLHSTTGPPEKSSLHH